MPKLTRGQIRYFARQSLTPVTGTGFLTHGRWPLYTPVPVFADNATNRAIDREEDRILRRRTHRRRPGPTAADWSDA
jgi:hypothetical protein